MKNIVAAALLATLAFFGSALAAPQQRRPSPPPIPAPPPVQQPVCDPRDSADYVPGIDVHGRPVAPADIPDNNSLIVSTEIYPQIRTNNPKAGSVGVAVQLDGLGASPRCEPRPADKSSRTR